jgi:hypothetical protein
VLALATPLALLSSTPAHPLAAQSAPPPSTSTAHLSPRAQRILADIRYLADDALGGRLTGSPGNDSAAAYIARELTRLGLRPGGDSGTYFQRWTAGNTTATREAGVANSATANVIAVLPGNGDLAGQAVVVGAHFDHLGLGPSGSLAPDSAGQIHNGADDNASGTAAALELARVLAADTDARQRPRPRRAVVFVLFSGEEQGLLGSAFYADHPAVPIESTYAMLNFDMVGRLRNGRLLAIGGATAAEWPALLDSANQRRGLDLRVSGDGWGRSDHSSFFAKDRPVLHFFTDLHDRYHRPSDDWPTIDAEGMVRVADLAADLTRRLRVRRETLTFVDAPPPAPPAAAGPGGRPVLGTIPDMTDEPGGVRLSGVRPGTPADSAGLRAGDVLIGLGGHEIGNLQDFQNALVAHRPGDRVEVRFRRDDQVMSVMVTLAGRASSN